MSQYKIFFQIKKMNKYFVLILLTVNCGNIFAQKQILKNTEFEEIFKQKKANKKESNTYLIKIRQEQDLKSLKNVRIIRRLSRYHYVIRSEQDPLSSNNRNLSYCSPTNQMYKASDNLLDFGLKHPKSEVRLTLKTSRAINPATLKSIGRIIDMRDNYITLDAPARNLPELLAEPAISFAELNRKANEESSVSNVDLSVNQVLRVHAFVPNLRGQGMVASIKENKYDNNDLDLLGRSLRSQNSPTSLTAHATTMATLIAGNGTSYIHGLGVAPQASLTNSDFSHLLPDELASFNQNHVRVQNHSYGTQIENYYGLEAHAYDEQIYQADTLMHVFSAGNIGTKSPVTGLYADLKNHANLSGTFKQAKNVLVIGGVNQENIIETLSSKGPAYDGRIKPELMAYGIDGTSEAAAITTGIVCLLQQHFLARTHQMPSSALLKSILVNTADDIGANHVDYDSGFGNINAAEAIKTINEMHFQSGIIQQGQTSQYPIEVTSSTKEFKVSLAWNDPPAELNAPEALVNDLDLWIEDPAGNLILPWTLNSAPDSISAPATRRKDHLNNIEQVSIANPQAGTYKIYVQGHSLSAGTSQTFHFSHQATPSDQFEWHFPSNEDQLFANDENYLRFKSTFSNSTGALYYSLDQGSTWELISSSISPTVSFYKWKTPKVFKKALLKMSISGKDFISRPFSISSPIDFQVGYNCNDELLLHWPKQAQSIGYTIYNLYNNVLRPLLSTADTLVRIPKETITSNYFAISANGTDGLNGIRGFTLDATEQGMGCYVGSLLTLVDQDVITINLDLGTIIGLDGTIQCQKLVGNDTYINLGSKPLSSILTYQFRDEQPKQGIQYYRVILHTQQGKEIVTDLVSAIYLDKLKFVLYPNPVSAQFSVLSGTIGVYELSIYTMDGKLIKKHALNTLHEDISINNLPSGMYICSISSEGKILFQTKLIKIE